MTRYHAELRVILERHGGTVEKFVGDAGARYRLAWRRVRATSTSSGLIGCALL
jgi:class 3 adenylate cyclase